jgi:undecaprenyl-phosphate 4-deoxy-4-formamido-L-arabinose transferase
VITLDDDLQHPPEEIPKLVRAIENGAEVAFGLPRDKKHTAFRNVGSALVQVTFQRTFSTSARPSALRGISRRVVDEVIRFDKSHIYLDGLFAWVTNRIVEVEVEHLPRERGVSGYSLRKLLALTLNFVTNSSLKPLQYSSVLGLVLSFISLSLAAYLVVRYFVVGIPVAGYASLFVLISLTGGIQLLSLGIIGEYVGRILMNSNGKPAFSVKQEILSSKTTPSA